MPRPKKNGDEFREAKKRSRNGCWPCKARKVKCGEEKPSCTTCIRQGEKCDYSIRLNWDGRSKKKDLGPGSGFVSMSSHFSAPASRNGFPPESILPAAFSAATESMSKPQISPPQSRSNSLDHSLPPITEFSQTLGSSIERFPAGQCMSTMRSPAWAEPSTLANNMHMSARLSSGQTAYPSPADSSYGSPSFASSTNLLLPASQMPPPSTAASQVPFPETVRSPYNGFKRMRLSPRADSFQMDGAPMKQYPNDESSRFAGFPRSARTSSSGIHSNSPTRTPSSSSLLSNDSDDRRISVSSLLSEGFGDRRRSSTSDPRGTGEGLTITSCDGLETKIYGHDRGHPDQDIFQHNDALATSGTTPAADSDFDSWLESADIGTPEFGFGLQSRGVVFAKGGYYASPVPIKIPCQFEPLPPALHENPMNMLYFHHFLNHTARILVPHDCPENPFRTILPRMAVKDPHLLNLLLAYSACHRARLLGHPEPKNRIAIWVRDLFPHLRQTLSSPSEKISVTSLVTAIMLASLEIISPSSFEIQVPWHVHLGLARSIIRDHCKPSSVSRKDQVMYFLTRWLAYLDVIGSLSGMRREEPLFAGNYWSSKEEDRSFSLESSSDSPADDTTHDMGDEADYTIDCMMGFTTKCVSILARVASLVHQCAEFRMDLSKKQIVTSWHPSGEILRRAEKLKQDLEEAQRHTPHQCLHNSPRLARSVIGHRCSSVDMSDTDAEESLATNRAYHWAGLVHLLRRVYNLPRTDRQVQNAVREVTRAISSIREGGSAMACILFPMFTAGAEAEHDLDHARILSRVKSLEELGLFQVGKARKIMEESRRTDRSWEFLVDGEFLG